MKQAKVKKINYNIKNSKISSNNEMSNLIKLVLVIVGLFVVFYVITLLVTKEKEIEKQDVPTTIQYDKILISNILSQNESSYYVLITREEDEYVDLYSNYLYLYSLKDKSLKYYVSNLDDVFNKSYLSEEVNLDTKDLNNLKLNSTALLKINNKKIVSIYNEKEDIVAQLEEMIK